MSKKIDVSSLIPEKPFAVLEKWNADLFTMDYSPLRITKIGHMADEPNQYYSSWYNRTDYCIQFVTKGKGKYFVNNHLYSLSSNTLFMLPLGKTYHFYTSDKQEPYEYYWAHFNGLAFENFLKIIGLSKENPVIYGIQNPNIEKLFLDIIEASKSKDTPNNNFLILSKSYRLLYEIIEGIPTLHTIKPKSFNRNVEFMIDYISKNYQSKITLELLAELLHINKFSLVDQFKSVTGLPPIQYLIQYRISKACHLLVSTKESVNDICYACGFQELTSFLIRFKKITGVTPSQFRSSIKPTIPVEQNSEG